MARPAGSAGAQGAATTELERGPIGSGLSRQEPGSVAYGGLHATLEEHEALIALLVRFDSSCVERCSFEARGALRRAYRRLLLVAQWSTQQRGPVGTPFSSRASVCRAKADTLPHRRGSEARVLSVLREALAEPANLAYLSSRTPSRRRDRSSGLRCACQ